MRLEPVGTFSETAFEPPTTVIYRVAGTRPEDSIHIERLGKADFQWCVVWYRLDGAAWNRMPAEKLFPTAEAALAAVKSSLAELDAGRRAASAVAAN